jgi:hypothetical protein
VQQEDRLAISLFANEDVMAFDDDTFAGFLVLFD